MNEIINNLIGLLSKLFNWWFIVMPWEQAVFIRAGKKIKVVNKGWYLRIPFVDRIYIQQTRLRIAEIPIQTISTKDGKTITMKATLAYSITDMVKVFENLCNPEATLVGIAMSGISQYISTKEYGELEPKQIENFLLSQLKDKDYGLGNLQVNIVSWADVKTYRLIQDNAYINLDSFKHLDEK